MQKPPFKLLPISAMITAMCLQAPFSYAEEEALILKEVEVSAESLSDTQPVKGYNATSSRTATKTDTDLIDVPQAVSVVTQELIKDMSLQSMTEVVQYVPGVQASQGEGNRDAVNFRGAGVTTGDFYVDGIRDDVQTYRDFYNTDRIEVLKGPNAMIFGRGGAGGVINRVSKEAGWDPVRELSVSYGAYDQKRTTIDLGQGLNDSVAFRLNAVYEDSDSYRDGVGIERYGITPTFTFKLSEQTRIVLGAEYFEDKRIGDRGQPSVNGAANSSLKNRPLDLGDTDQFFGNARLSPNETETTAFNAMIEHIFDNGITLRNRTRYADYDKYYQNVFASSALRNDGTIGVSAYRDETDRENLINQTDLTYDLQLGGVQHKLLAGMEIGKQDTDNARLTPTGGEGLGNVTLDDPIFRGPVAFDTYSRNRKSEAEFTAFYLQDQIVLSPMWELVLGLRHDKFEVDHTNLLSGENFDTTDNKLSPRAGLIFKPLQNLSLYASYSKTFAPRAGDQLSDLTLVSSDFAPEKFINHEIGAKYDITPDFSVTAAIYKLERENVAVANPLDPLETILVDGQETKGFEMGLSGKVTSKWSVFGGYAYQDGEISKDQGTTILKGADLAQTPEHTFSLWNRYDFNDTWGAAIGVISRSDMYAAVPTITTSTTLAGYTRYDAAIYGKLSENLRLQVNLENLTNKEYALSAHNNNNIVPGSPFTGRATLTYNF
ncbi:MAG: TonB-dependent siderophore receptor [Betaproteobacteria bacterium HGW-Betaproteobacteria-2]|nr:MAG: TonB-dependent siderophore receptor [Betaproteobacteria bacterium HGW-Betaproteobacteria-2]